MGSVSLRKKEPWKLEGLHCDGGGYGNDGGKFRFRYGFACAAGLLLVPDLLCVTYM